MQPKEKGAASATVERSLLDEILDETRGAKKEKPPMLVLDPLVSFREAPQPAPPLKVEATFKNSGMDWLDQRIQEKFPDKPRTATQAADDRYRILDVQFEPIWEKPEPRLDMVSYLRRLQGQFLTEMYAYPTKVRPDAFRPPERQHVPYYERRPERPVEKKPLQFLPMDPPEPADDPSPELVKLADEKLGRDNLIEPPPRPPQRACPICGDPRCWRSMFRF